MRILFLTALWIVAFIYYNYFYNGPSGMSETSSLRGLRFSGNQALPIPECFGNSVHELSNLPGEVPLENFSCEKPLEDWKSDDDDDDDEEEVEDEVVLAIAEADLGESFGHSFPEDE